MIGAALIQNPNNPYEIMMFDSCDAESTMIYNTITNEYDDNLINLNTIAGTETIKSINAINSTKHDKIILFGSKEHPQLYTNNILRII